MYTFSVSYFIKIVKVRTGERTQWLRVHTALSEELRSVPSTNVRQLITSSNSSSRESTSGPLGLCTQEHMPPYTHIQITKNNKNP